LNTYQESKEFAACADFLVSQPFNDLLDDLVASFYFEEVSNKKMPQLIQFFHNLKDKENLLNNLDAQQLKKIALNLIYRGERFLLSPL